MGQAIDVKLFFNFRSPYCYLVSKSLDRVFDDYHTNLIWRPLGGWDGRSSPERAKVKVPLVRQDMARWAKKMGIPLTPPPLETDPSKAGAGSFLAEEKGLLREYITEVMRAEWAEGLNIGEENVLFDVCEKIGLDQKEFSNAIIAEENHQRLADVKKEADELGVIGVPTFVIEDQIFWGNDRVDFVVDHLNDLRLKKV